MDAAYGRICLSLNKTLTVDTSVKRAINKTFLFFNFTEFHQNRMKNKKVLLLAHFVGRIVKIVHSEMEENKDKTSPTCFEAITQ